ncbi:MAG: nuclear transport factor 2 family protein [Pseudomonadota bacterium]
MMKETSVLLTLVVLLVATVPALSDGWDCVVADAQQKVRHHELSASEEKIMKLERDACHAIIANEIDPMIDSIIANDGLLFVDGGPIVVGKEAQRGMFKEFLGAGFKIEFEPTDAHVSSSQDMAWAYGLYRLRMPDGGEGNGKYVSVWEKQDGVWKNVVEMRNSGK